MSNQNSYKCAACKNPGPCVTFTSEHPNACLFFGIELDTNWTLLVRGDSQ